MARNAGAVAARGDLLVYCDADDRAEPGWLAGLVKAARSCDVVGGRLAPAALSAVGSNELPDWADDLAEALPRTLRFLPYGVGANLGIWAEVLRALGGWREAHRDGADDIDLCWRAQLASYRLGFAPRAVMQYRLRRGMLAIASQRYRYGLADPRLYRDFRTHGVPPCELRHAIAAYNIALDAQHLLSRRKRESWIGELAYRMGRLHGCGYKYTRPSALRARQIE